jgi:hypothetical protein
MVVPSLVDKRKRIHSLFLISLTGEILPEFQNTTAPLDRATTSKQPSTVDRATARKQPSTVSDSTTGTTHVTSGRTRPKAPQDSGTDKF